MYPFEGYSTQTVNGYEAAIQKSARRLPQHSVGLLLVMGDSNPQNPESCCGGALGLIAGRGELPLAVCRAARKAGEARIVAAAMYGETSLEIETLADTVGWFYVGQLDRAIRFMKDAGVTRCMFIGQVRPRRLFTGFRPDLRAFRILRRLRERNACTIFGAVADEFEREGMRVLPCTTFLEHWLAREGVLGRVKPGKRVQQDIAFGRRIAEEISRLDIGQTVVVKKGTVVAVEGFDGTDETIRRGGLVGHGGVTVVKVAKAGHDMRFDAPCIGLRTVESLRMARARALAVTAGKALLIHYDQVLAACDRAGIAVVGLPPGG